MVWSGGVCVVVGGVWSGVVWCDVMCGVVRWCVVCGVWCGQVWGVVMWGVGWYHWNGCILLHTFMCTPDANTHTPPQSPPEFSFFVCQAVLKDGVQIPHELGGSHVAPSASPGSSGKAAQM